VRSPPSDGEQLAQQLRADPAGRLHPGLVQPVKGRYQLLELDRLDRRVGWGSAVPASGEQVDVVAQQMQCDILDRPAWAHRGCLPLPGAKRGEQPKERRPLGREQVADDDGIGVHAGHCVALATTSANALRLVRGFEPLTPCMPYTDLRPYHGRLQLTSCRLVVRWVPWLTVSDRWFAAPWRPPRLVLELAA
jgi:hypothetical protein